MVHYKLNYFNIRGRAELSRLLFAAANQPFEDRRIEQQDWPALKSQSPGGKMPWLEINDGATTHVLFQSLAIARYLARKFGFAGKTDLEQAEADMYADQLQDLMNEFGEVYREVDEAKKKQLEAKVANESVPGVLKMFEERLAKSTSGLLLNSGLCYTDLFLLNVLDFMTDKHDQIFTYFPHVKNLYNKVTTIPNLAAYLAKRPKTDA